VEPDTLGSELYEHIARRLANLGGTPLIEFGPAARLQRLVGLSNGTYSFHVADCGDRLLGLVPLEVTIYEKGVVKQVQPVLANVSLRKAVVVAARAINRGETIKAGSLSLQDRVFTQVDNIGLTEIAPLVGQRAKRFIKEGAAVSLRDIEPVPLVSRNDLVTVWVACGRVRIKATARAMSSGGYGKAVELSSELSNKERFTGIVTGPKTVELPGSDALASNGVQLPEQGR